MNNFTKILNTIRRPFQQELRKGCYDNVVVNGLGSYVQLWAKNGDAFTLAATEKEVLSGLASLFENYADASPSERQRTLEDATKQINAALSGEQRLPVNISDTSTETLQNPQQRTTQPTRPKKDTQPEILSLFGETKNPPERAPTKREPPPLPTTHKARTEHLPLLGDTDDFSQHSESTPSEEVAESVPISDAPVSTDLASLDFLSEPLQFLKGIGPRRASMLREELNLQTVGEFLAYYPRDYIDRSKMIEIYRVGRREDDEPETIQGKVVNHTSSPTAKGKRIGKISIYDGTGVAMLVNFGRRIGIMKSLLPVDTEVVVSGKFTRRYN